MTQHAINQQVFEFSCHSEERAAEIRKELIHYTASQINSVLASVLDQYIPAQQTVVIDQLEIDLGDLLLEELGTDEMIDRFRNALAGEIIRYRQPVAASGPAAQGSAQPGSLPRSYELTTSFILTGDLPWWTDKTADTELDAHLAILIRDYPEQLKIFLQTLQGNRKALLRIARQYKPSTKKALQSLMPELQSLRPFPIEPPSADATPEDNTTWPMQELLEQADLFFHPAGRTKKENRRKRLAHNILRFLVAGWIPTKQFTWLPAALQQVMSEVTVDKKGFRQKALSLLLDLPMPQLEMLLMYTNSLQRHSLSAEEKTQTPTAKAGHTGSNPEEKVYSDNGLPENEHVHDQSSENKETSDVRSFFDREPADQIHLSPSPPESNTTTERGLPENTSFRQLSEKSALQQENRVPNIIPQDKADLTLEENQSRSEKMALSEEKSAYTQRPEEAFQHEPASSTSSGSLENFSPAEQAHKTTATEPVTGESRVSTNLSGHQQKQIAFIANNLDTADPVFVEYLQSLSPADIRSLVKSIRAEKKEVVQLRMQADALMLHPFLVEYRLILLAATLPFPAHPGNPHRSVSEEVSSPKQSAHRQLLVRLRTSQESLVKALHALPAKHAMILEPVLTKSNGASPDDQRHLKKLLRKLPEPALQLLQFLTQLPEPLLHNLQQTDPRSPAARERLSTREPLFGTQEEGPKKFYLSNGGLCLVAPYLPGLFSQLGYLENRAFKNSFYAVRALHALHYMATGSRKAPEFQLLLNKLLCGLPPEHAPGFNIRLTKKETAEIDDCLVAVIANWKALKNTSPQGFRESFLRRNAILFEKESGWTLQVEKKDYDLLLNTVPWNFSMIRLPWMKKMLQVEWQN